MIHRLLSYLFTISISSTKLIQSKSQLTLNIFLSTLTVSSAKIPFPIFLYTLRRTQSSKKWVHHPVVDKFSSQLLRSLKSRPSPLHSTPLAFLKICFPILKIGVLQKEIIRSLQHLMQFLSFRQRRTWLRQITYTGSQHSNAISTSKNTPRSSLSQHMFCLLVTSSTTLPLPLSFTPKIEAEEWYIISLFAEKNVEMSEDKNCETCIVSTS